MSTKEEVINMEPLILRARDEFMQRHSLGQIEQKAPVDLHKLQMLAIKYHNDCKLYKDKPDCIKIIEDNTILGIVDLLRDTQLVDMFNTDVCCKTK